ncbi:uncharacterized protein [Branchiostoma lanceolatum]|uniref:uncharacterized protein n=1 Tax=Branchiostoma lanceolatum TaxID=7740 RepID=UPI003451263A
MYLKAMSGYNLLIGMEHAERPEVKKTLLHRIMYTEKVWESKGQPDAPNRGEGRRKMEQQLKEMTRPIRDREISSSKSESGMTAAAVTVIDNKGSDRQYQDYLKKGHSSLEKTDLDSAEKHFAAALKIAHVREPTSQQYQREVEPLCKLGDVYRKRGQQTRDGGDFVKAAALYCAAIARSKDEAVNGKMEMTLTDTENAFLRYVLYTELNVSLDDKAKHTKMLKEMRDQIKLEMDTIDQQLDPYVRDEGDPRVKEIEAKRAKVLRKLFESIVEGRKKFISLLVEECITIMGSPPCEYALIGLGSQATGLVTPYSDLEFAILVEEESEEYLAYFRNLTHYLHLKVVNLGETILPALGIESLNDFYSDNPLDSWYYDSVTPRGFAFDGSMPKASKTPLGRQGTKNKPPSELIRTPENMVSMLQNDVTLYLKEGYHLSTVLRNPCLIAGDQDLIDTYMGITLKTLQADGGKLTQQLAREILDENMKRLDTQTVTAKMIDVKKGLYRFPALAVDCLALSSCIMPTTVWKTIDEMKLQGVVSDENAHHLGVLVAISAELRLRTYIANGGQKENLSALASMESVFFDRQESPPQSDDEVQRNALKQVFYLPNEKQLFRYYYSAVPLKTFLSKSSEMKPAINSLPELYNASCAIRAIMYYELCEFKQAIHLLNKALSEDADIERTTLLNCMGNACMMLGDHRKAIRFQKEALAKTKEIYGAEAKHPEIANLLHCIGSACERAGDYKKAASYFDQALQMNCQIHGKSTTHSDIATALSRLGALWVRLGNPNKTIGYATQALQMQRSIYGQSTSHPDIATSLNILGNAFSSLGNDRKSLAYQEEALQMTRSLYGQYTAYPDIANALASVGKTWHTLGDYRKAITYLEMALQMCSSIYGKNTAHCDRANIHNTLGLVWQELGEYGRAISNHEQALLMYRSVYGQSTAHKEIAIALNNLGLNWFNLGDYKKASGYYDMALDMYRSVYGQNTPHFDIATSLNNKGQVCDALGDYRKAIGYFEQALHMRLTILGKSAEHHVIADILNNLGAAWNNLQDYGNAIIHYEKALKMYRSIYGPSTPHADIAMSLGNLGQAWGNCYGDYRKSISYHEQALQMYRSIHGQAAIHSDIAISLSNLGGAWLYLDETMKGIRNYEKALGMYKSIYGQSVSHHNIATVLGNLGTAWRDLGDYKKAISYYEQALQMCRVIYGQATVHPEVAMLLGYLGGLWRLLNDHRKAIRYLDQALQMFKSIHGQSKARPDIAEVLGHLGESWSGLHDYDRGITYIEQALQMQRSIHGQSTAHINIAMLLYNMGAIRHSLGCHTEALSWYQEALAMAWKLDPSDKSTSLITQIQENVGMMKSFFSISNN